MDLLNVSLALQGLLREDIFINKFSLRKEKIGIKKKGGG